MTDGAFGTTNAGYFRRLKAREREEIVGRKRRFGVHDVLKRCRKLGEFQRPMQELLND